MPQTGWKPSRPIGRTALPTASASSAKMTANFMAAAASTRSMKHPIANLGYWIKTPSTGKGIATEATIALARFCIQKIGLQRIEIIMSVQNGASKAVAISRRRPIRRPRQKPPAAPRQTPRRLPLLHHPRRPHLNPASPTENPQSSRRKPQSSRPKHSVISTETLSHLDRSGEISHLSPPTPQSPPATPKQSKPHFPTYKTPNSANPSQFARIAPFAPPPFPKRTGQP